ncbi:DNA-binding response regulator [Streptomyces spinoverrucosus]|uniref:DNA-binding response regulator n=1 Tax=Streptomyces spinoverrucosus TaxID=284043 RepID=A0A4Y3VU00_9ACTN|nr:response regulator transcription factor [Streptomyces spinoverrucosus]GEC09555.1 DNA-binding response regulator [Streptomyces spinoverrucosus]GHB95919.1 DNA-binding response regulator [Streptomyces spinoverrucosus]
MPHVLLVEDDDHIRTALAGSLHDLGHRVDAVATAVEGLSRAVSTSPDIVVLDLGLPDMDGLQALKMLRAGTPVPVVIATARDDERHTVRALDLGADDYVIKPFSVEHLNARLAAVLRRATPAAPEPTLAVGDLRIDLQAHTATLEGRPLELRPKEFRLLAYLAGHAGRVVGKDELRQTVWDSVFGITDKTMDVHLSWLRRRLGETAASPRYLHSVRGVGVKLVDPGQ